MSKIANLTKRTGTNNYYYRESVPLDVQNIMKRSGEPRTIEVWKSLGTASLQNAKTALVTVRAEQHNRWADIRALANKPITTPTDRELQSAAVQYGYDQAFETQAKSIRKKAIDGDLNDILIKKRESLQNRVLNPDDQEDVDRLAVAIVRKEKWQLDEGQITLFRKYLIEAFIDSLHAVIVIFEGKPKPDPKSSVVRQMKEQGAEAASRGETIVELFELYKKSKIADGKKSKSSLSDAQIVIEQFSNYVGSKRALSGIEKAEVRKFRDIYASVPTRWSTRKEFKGMSLTQVSQKAVAGDWPVRSVATIAKAISDISSFWSWAIMEGYAVDNPSLGLKPNPDRESGRMPPYTPDQLKLFFDSPLFTGCDVKPGKEHLPGDTHIRDWRYWIPIISLFTGARVGEIAQLRCDDVKCLDSFWIFDIHKEPDQNAAKSLKNKNSVRPVPIHTDLIKLGFLDYLKATQVGIGSLLFPQIKLDHRQQMGSGPSRFIRTYLTRIKLKEKGLGVHSFRHTWTDECRRRGIYDALSGSILGHSKGTMTSHYGASTEGNLKQRKDAIDTLVFEGFDLLRKRADNPESGL